MKKLFAILVVISVLLTSLCLPALAGSSSTSWKKVGSSFTVTTTKDNATVTIELRTTRNRLGMYPQSKVTVKFNGAGSTYSLSTKGYIIIPSNGKVSKTIKIRKAGTYTFTTEWGMMGSWNSNGGSAEWRVASCKNASVR